MKLGGKTAFITGASRNIGRAIALAFAAEGADLIVNTRVNRDELEAVAEECRKAGVRVVPALGDIADAAAVDRMVNEGLAELGGIDILVCNAAIRPHKSLAETSLEDWHHVMGVNLHSAFYLARAVIPGMKERKRGSIIAIGGQSSLTGRPNTAAVTAAKTGTLGLVRARRLAKTADLACALSLEALQGSRSSFLPAVQELRPLHGQRDSDSS